MQCLTFNISSVSLLRRPRSPEDASVTAVDNEEGMKSFYAQGAADESVSPCAPQSLELVQRLPVLISSWAVVSSTEKASGKVSEVIETEPGPCSFPSNR